MKERIKKVLKELAKTRVEFWNISPETGKFLNYLIKDRKLNTVIEIGTSNGYSGMWLAEALSHTDGHLYTIESHRERFHLAKENFNKSRLSGNITQIRGHAPEALPQTPKFFDMAFFDATKEEHFEHFNILKNRIKKGGIIATDNSISHKKELSTFTKIITNEPGWQTFNLKIGSGLLISIKS